MRKVTLNLTGTPEEILGLYGMCYSYTKMVQKNKMPAGMFGQILFQIQPQAREIITSYGMNWDDHIKELDMQITAELKK